MTVSHIHAPRISFRERMEASSRNGAAPHCRALRFHMGLRFVLRSSAGVVGIGTVLAVSMAARSPAPLVLSCDAFPPNATLASVRAAFEATEVATESLPFGPSEGDMVPATVLFPKDPARRIEIVWKDAAAQRRPRIVHVAHGPTRWRTPAGITIGTSLRELEQLNARPFQVAGFGFDGAGAVVSWDGGRLAQSSAGCTLRIRLDSLTNVKRRSADYKIVRGDRTFASSTRAMRALDPRVSSLLLEYP